jgi:hypothetical protein
VIAQVSNNVYGEPMAWQFLKDNWDALFDRYGASSFAFADLIEGKQCTSNGHTMR